MSVIILIDQKPKKERKNIDNRSRGNNTEVALTLCRAYYFNFRYTVLSLKIERTLLLRNN